MGRKRGKRVAKVKHGYGDKKRSVRVSNDSAGLEKVVERRVERGYRKGYKKRGKEGRRLELGYTGKGTPVRQERKARGKPSRPVMVSKQERWGRKGERGTRRRQTTAGRRTAEEAMEKEVGGVRRVWVN